MPNTSQVCSARKRETAVTMSERRMAWRVLCRKLGSAPTNVTSVPCSVVMTRVRPVMAWAWMAAVACGMA